MRVPPEFSKACRNLHQDIGLIVSTPEQMVSVAIEGLSTKEKDVVKTFLDKILRGAHNGASLRNVWRSTGSDIYFPKAEDLLSFLRLMQASLG